MSCGPTSHRPFTARGHRALKKKKKEKVSNLSLDRICVYKDRRNRDLISGGDLQRLVLWSP